MAIQPSRHELIRCCMFRPCPYVPGHHEQLHTRQHLLHIARTQPQQQQQQQQRPEEPVPCPCRAGQHTVNAQYALYTLHTVHTSHMPALKA